MNKTAVKNFAIWARVNLIESAKQRAYEYEITENGSNNASADVIGGRPLSKDEKEQRAQLIGQINAKSFNQVMEEAAYTWFNRFIALRFMEVNGYLPTRIRVFTNEEGEFKPEILKEAMTVELDGLDRDKILDLLDKQDNEALYKMLLIAQCNSLSEGLPYMFEKIANWTELLFPANLLKSESVIGQMVSSIPEEDWTDAVQIIGWLYQYYNSELKDETFALLKKNIKITKERIPAATQLFTPDWIVRYMVENSLGRIYIQRKLVNSGDWLVADEATKVSMEKKEAETMGWKYYLPEAEQEPEVRKQLMQISNTYTRMKVEDIKVIDPCMGSGHILVYAFDVLMQIYTASGWSERDAAKSIIENNIYGLDIDDRAGQLAYFAVMMKARKYNRRILNGSYRPNVMAIQDSSFMTDELVEYVSAGNKDIKASLNAIRTVFKDAKEYGSILEVNPVDVASIYQRLDEIAGSTPEDLFALMNKELAVGPLYRLVKQAEIMGQKYEVVTTNPPYMGVSNASPKVVNYVKDKYSKNKIDLFSVFMEKAIDLLESDGYCALITQQTWMFISSFQSTRQMLDQYKMTTLCHLGTRTFEDISGEVVQSVAYSLQKSKAVDYIASFVKLDDTDSKEEEFENPQRRFATNIKSFSKLPDGIYAYWLGDTVADSFVKHKPVSSSVDGKIGLQTGDNNRFLRLWQEIDFTRFSTEGAKQNQYWVPYNKAGGFRRWYGNHDYVLNWDNDGFEIVNCRDENGRQKSRPQNREYYFRSGLTWSDVCTGKYSMRRMPENFVFDSCAPSMFSNDVPENYILALYNTNVAQMYLNFLAPTIHYTCGSVLKMPLIYDKSFDLQIVDECIEIAKQDWDSFENSWDFVSHPLIGNYRKIEDAFDAWKDICEFRFQRMKQNEEYINGFFANLYGLPDAFDRSVDDEYVTVRKANLARDIKSLISYAVGCMLGRYSLDKTGIAYAGGTIDESSYQSIKIDSDAILPITDDEYFTDDIVSRFVAFIKTAYGADNLEENLKFIANALSNKGTARDVIRNYFLNEFYSDHCNTYSVTGSGKRPIYWLFDSGKKNGFKCLIYMHRYQPDTIARIRTDYIHELQSRYRTAIADLEDCVEHAAAGDKVKLNKQLAKIKDQELELRQYEEKIHHLADQMISIDLDDGVKVNYAKFQDVLAKIK